MSASSSDEPSDKSKREIHEQSLSTAGFLGGISFTGLVLVLSSASTFNTPVWIIPAEGYFVIVATSLAITSTLFIVASLSMQQVASGTADIDSPKADFAVYCFLLGVLGFLIDLPLLLVPFTTVGAVAVVVVEIILAYSYVTLSGIRRKLL
ncbi:MAG: hypothetical protein OK452_07345 [Thaumarchaeota archaeon]|nr:hypothetical protein [Nitrososphaerota archaeon]